MSRLLRLQGWGRVIAPLMACWLPAAVQGSDSVPAMDIRVSLQQVLAAAREQDPRLRAASGEAERAELQAELVRVRGSQPSLTLSGYGGLIPGKTGDREEFDRIGPFHRAELDVIWPIFSFGRTPALLRAARQGAAAEQARRDMVVGVVDLDVIRTFEGLAAARAGEELTRELRSRYDELLRTLHEALEDEDSGVDDGDLLEAETHALTIEKAAAAAQEGEYLLFRLLARWLGRSPEQRFELEPSALPAWGAGPEVIDLLLERAKVRRPDYQAAAAATRATVERREATRLASRPTVYVGGQVGHAMAANRREALDSGQFNYTRVAALMGMRWDLTAARLRLEEAMADAEHRVMAARRDTLAAAVEAEVAAAVAAVERSSRLLEAARRSHGAAQRWLRVSSDNWDMGLGDLRRLIRAHEAFYSLRGEIIKAELEYRTSLIQLAHVLGDASLYTHWCEHERLVFP